MSKVKKLLIAVMVFAFFLKIGISLYMKSPWIFADEVIYFKQAQLIFENFNFLYTTEFAQTYPFAYSLIISPAFLLKDPNDVYHAMLIINALLSTLSSVVAFLLIRKFIKNEYKAVAIAFIIAFIPAIFIYTFTLMSENLYNLLFLLSIYLVYVSFETEKKIYWASTGLIIALSILTRMFALILIPAILISVLAYFIHNLENIKKAIPNIICLFIGLVIGLLPKFVQANTQVTGYNNRIYLDNLLSMFSNTENFELMMKLILNEINYLFISSLGILFVATLYIIISAFKKNTGSNEKGVMIYFISSVIFSIVLTVAHMYIAASNPSHSEHLSYFVFGRYIEPLVPVLFIFGFIGLEKLNLKSKIFLVLSCLLIFFIIIFTFPKSHYKFPNMFSLWFTQVNLRFLSIAVFAYILSVTVLLSNIRFRYKVVPTLIILFLFNFAPLFKIVKSSSNAREFIVASWFYENKIYDKKIYIDEQRYHPTQYFGTLFWARRNSVHVLSLKEIKDYKNGFFITTELLPYKIVRSEKDYKLYNLAGNLVSDNLKEYINFGENDENAHFEGFYGSEHNSKFSFRWTNGSAKILFPVKSRNVNYELQFRASSRPDITPSDMGIFVNGQPISRIKTVKGIHTYTIKISKGIIKKIPDEYFELSIFNKPFNPKELDISQDNRDLGLAFDWISLKED
ncbi:ArnT family glycosyltransferase [Phosphitispora fastidiosa]|uniref:ArnT family glycosyltransferase n=1 Tax=Phosphitispora fastidiosa TaxID=2837202 RepID=UPI001E3615D9|nr:glycosyltransferase family 39 protein [Phosphitispora fastidiosa]MBU7008173.1 4-amino-4-deoxy-L-arabinose transferase-like glycosyltransferase [Phosphitispora fastidiosa]